MGSRLLAALATTTALCTPAWAAAPALPTGGKVVAGSAVIGAPSGGALIVNQSSSEAIVNWGSFSIGLGSKVTFDNGSGATLNRVTGGSLSDIEGLLTGTGSVYLINPNGVIVGKSGVVDVGGTFVASTLDTSNAQFLAGGPLTFTGTSSAAVVNYGKIGALGGDVALIAANVSNAGSISAADGDAGLIAGYKVVLTDASLDDGRFAVELGGAGVSVTNSGLIQAADAELRAEGGNIYALAGDTAGVIRATGVSSGGGHVWLVADGGTLDVAGTIAAQGAGGAAGTIETSGQDVSLGSAAIDAHGGTWTVDPEDLTIDSTAAGTIDTALNAGTSVLEQTTATGTSGAGTANPAGNGDIIVSAPLSWSTTAALTLSAYRNVDVNATITLTGAGTLNLDADNSATGTGTVIFGGTAPQVTAASGAMVNILYNPVSYTDSATHTTASGTPNVYTGPYNSDVSGGTLMSYMLVNSLAELQSINTELSGSYALNTNIDATATATMNPISGGGYAGFVPLGNVDNGGTAFTGAFNGEGHTISNLYINDTTTSDVGLFGALDAGAPISNLNVVNANVTGTAGNNAIIVGIDDATDVLNNLYASGVIGDSGYFNGGIVGQTGGTTTIENSHANVTVQGGQYLGGLIGYDGGSTLTNVYATGAVGGAGVSDVGGLVGVASGPITNAYATGAVTGNDHVGGLIGFYNDNSSTITNAYATGAVTAASTTQSGTFFYIGGLIGEATGSFTNVYATGNVTAINGPVQDQTGAVGGLIGYLYTATLTDAYATGAVTTTGQTVGGLVGYNGGAIGNAYASGAVSGSGAVGGLVGYMANYPTGSTVSDSYATGSVTGVQSSDSDVVNDIGGLVGVNSHETGASPEGVITNSYATGAVSGFGVLGGFAGENDGSIVGSIWDVTSTAQASGVGVTGTTGTATLTSVQDTNPLGVDYAFSTTPYKAAGFTFATTPGTAGAWVIVDQDGSLNNAAAAAGGTRPFLLTEYSTTITNPHQLQLMELDLAADYTLGGDIDASGTGAAATAPASDMWSPAGFVPIAANNIYTGIFDGQTFAISGLFINSTVASDTGLFGFSGGTLENVSLIGGSISSNSSYGNVGALAGTSLGTVSDVTSSAAVNATSVDTVGGLLGINLGSVTNVSVTGPVSGGPFVGGLVGENGEDGSTISNAYATGVVTGGSGSVAGGLVGLNAGAAVSDSYATGAVSGDTTGGLVGENQGGTISASYASGDVSGTSQVGGLVGYNENFRVNAVYLSAITGSDATGSVTGSGSEVGGLVGENEGGAVTDSYATGNVSGVSQVGGLVGASLLDTTTNPGTTYTPSITGSVAGTTYASGSVTGTATSAGGLVGENQGTITLASYANATGVIGAADVGGAVGLNDAGATLTNVSVAAPVTSTSYTGGVVGDNFGTLTTVSYQGAVSGGGGVGGIVGVNEGGASVASATLGGATSGVTVTGTADDVGAVAGANFGSLGSAGSVIGAELINVTGLDDVGGIVGYNSGALFAYYAGTVTGRDYVGGVVGLNYGTVQSSSSGVVNGAEYVGGVIGWNDTQGTLIPTFTNASVTASGDYAGGLIGVNKGTLSSVTAGTNGDFGVGGSVSGSGYVGGLVGLNEGSITYSTSVVPVSGDLYVGGLVGWNNTGATINTSYATGSVTGVAGGQDAAGNDYVGGLVGVNFGSIANSYATGAVSGVQVVGGLVGTNMPGGASVSTSYAIGSVAASAGAVGTTFGVQAGEVTDVYGFPSLSGQPLESGYYNAGASGDGTDLTAAQEDGSAAYMGFDFTNTWQSNPDGTPTLLEPPK